MGTICMSLATGFVLVLILRILQMAREGDWDLVLLVVVLAALAMIGVLWV